LGQRGAGMAGVGAAGVFHGARGVAEFWLQNEVGKG
jgi:hypothetical protein